jgi:hypothetical protein
MRYARAKDDVIVEIYESPGMATISDCFHPAIACEFFEAMGDIQVGWTMNEGGEWVSPPSPPIPPQEPPVVQQ